MGSDRLIPSLKAGVMFPFPRNGEVMLVQGLLSPPDNHGAHGRVLPLEGDELKPRSGGDPLTQLVPRETPLGRSIIQSSLP